MVNEKKNLYHETVEIVEEISEQDKEMYWTAILLTLSCSQLCFLEPELTGPI